MKRFLPFFLSSKIMLFLGLNLNGLQSLLFASFTIANPLLYIDDIKFKKKDSLKYSRKLIQIISEDEDEAAYELLISFLDMEKNNQRKKKRGGFIDFLHTTLFSIKCCNEQEHASTLLTWCIFKGWNQCASSLFDHLPSIYLPDDLLSSQPLALALAYKNQGENFLKSFVDHPSFSISHPATKAILKNIATNLFRYSSLPLLIPHLCSDKHKNFLFLLLEENENLLTYMSFHPLFIKALFHHHASIFSDKAVSILMIICSLAQKEYEQNPTNTLCKDSAVYATLFLYPYLEKNSLPYIKKRIPKGEEEFPIVNEIVFRAEVVFFMKNSSEHMLDKVLANPHSTSYLSYWLFPIKQENISLLEYLEKEEDEHSNFELLKKICAPVFNAEEFKGKTGEIWHLVRHLAFKKDSLSLSHLPFLLGESDLLRRTKVRGFRSLIGLNY